MSVCWPGGIPAGVVEKEHEEMKGEKEIKEKEQVLRKEGGTGGQQPKERRRKRTLQHKRNLVRL